MPHKAPQYLFVARDYAVEAEYADGFSVAELMPVNSIGVMTKRDSVTLCESPAEVKSRVIDFRTMSRSEIDLKYKDAHDARDWNLAGIKKNIEICGFNHIRPIMVRPFDYRFTYYTDFSKGFLAYPVYDVGRHILSANLCLTTIRKADVLQGWSHVLTVDGIMIHHALTMKEGNYIFPLYLYPRERDIERSIRVNFNEGLYAQIRQAAGLTCPLVAPDGSDAFRHATGNARPDEVKVFDYIYGVLHCPAYRKTFAEFLKIDFPRVPFPPSQKVFSKVSEQGETLRRLHLMEDAAIGETACFFLGDGDSVVEKPRISDGKVWINSSQYFEKVSFVAWDFRIGGYKPAQKWLKDRKGRALSWDDTCHYQKIIKVMTETDRVMRVIDFPLVTVAGN